MKTHFTTLANVWGHLIVEELIRLGVTRFCIAPGSRSTPLVTAVAEHKNAQAFTHFDERGLGFFALGLAKATHESVAVITTSGSAVANLLPAVVEASQDHVPLIILTADRPPELLESGANQAIAQTGIFGKFCRWDVNLPCPAKEITPEFVLTTIDQAFRHAVHDSPGPVHVNCAFREPFTPLARTEDFSSYLAPLAKWQAEEAPHTTLVVKSDDVNLQPVAEQIRQSKSGLIVAGRLKKSDADSVLALARHLQWPVAADVASQLRFRKDPMIVHYFEESAIEDLDTLLLLGSPGVSKAVQTYLDRSEAVQIQVLPHANRQNPSHSAMVRVESKIEAFCRAMLASVPARSTRSRVQFVPTTPTGFTESAIAWWMTQHLPGKCSLFCSNSLPIRLMDQFGSPNDSDVHVGVNRGASGIDGIAATAAGFSCANDEPMVLLIGDLAMLHDLNSLPLLKQHVKSGVVVVLNNDGGGIFSTLPIAQSNEHFDKFFKMPHRLTFESAAKMFDLSYARCRTMDEFKTAWQKAWGTPGLWLLEADVR